MFLESIIIASAYKVLRKRFLKPDTIGLIPSGWYSGNVNYSNKAMMWLVYRERTDGCTILHARNGREYRTPELPNLSVDGFCPECTSSSVAFSTVTRVNPFVTSPHYEGIR